MSLKLGKKVTKNKFRLLIAISLLFINALLIKNISAASTTSELDLTNEDIPWPTGNWTTSTLVDQGMNPAKISDLKSYINRFNKEIHSMLIVKNGFLVEEEYFGVDSRKDVPHWVYSVTKSITATLVGIAINEGYLIGVNQTVVDFFPNRTFQNMDSAKLNITIEHLLTMTSGLEWQEWWVDYYNPANDFRKMRDTSSDWIQYILDKPVIATPGTQFNYNGGNCHLLSAIIQAVYNDTMEAFADVYLFSPLNITDYYWGKDPQGITQGETYLSLTSRDMAKFGYLYLNNGTWENTQLVPEEWIKKSTEELVSITHSGQYSYGYLWWLSKTTVQHFQAHGWHGQNIYVIPEKNLVVVFTSDEATFLLAYGYGLIQSFIIPATNPPVSSSITSTTSSETTQESSSISSTVEDSTTTTTTAQTTSLLVIEVACLSFLFFKRKRNS
jgi:CubicO group peptidase (beta-lactamase class C family)